MSGPVARFRALPLRSRLALLTATAVAVAVAAVSVACWLLTRAQLRDELDASLHGLSVQDDYQRLLAFACRPSGGPAQGNTAPGTAYVQIVRPDGSRCVGAGTPPVVVERSDAEVAAGLRAESLHDGVTTGGQPVRVLTRTDAETRYTVSISRPLTEVDGALNQLALVLAVLAGIGVVGAGAAGLWVARTGLKPVDRLTGAVEHVARTEDLTVRIPVEGEDEIARLSRSFNAMTAALASSRDRQAQLIADAGHELRTPLTSLRTNVELLARSEETGRAIPPEDRRALMASVKAQMTELAALIGDLQELARPDAAAPGKLEVVALHDLLGTALARARLRGPELTVSAVDVRPWYVRAEPAGLERALVNVLDNAVKFSSPGGTVEVALVDGEVTVRDHGPGIAPEELPHVFERFWRSPSARSLPGSGLGLSIVARTVRQAGGEVALTAAEGGGTRAVIRLPGAPTPPPAAPGG
ncbi:HAMP domain-containing histidine kinase [Streptomyces sp. WAC05374]|uniref:sensor histidine kinase n=1 Tax=Streptomyces sp. WAC05374 TaxID=2487420 RepID=UPI000F87F08C|nr:HAMP domain-containing sensor histidine kinase [Streptomyces sp. WAC05374]RST17231.1 sensor histidine kinase [Streptomyces sp. WAC05374]TDF47363.1 HAMP domain-containing histidine kinase [Streptomyces sp. WAC05374]TDF57621.1 HAMP domain-containing histidine kinase [Streptomyces sp. WAC05374]TDF61726.1 HAMP domain-containing histidine kinase [Streptomyces sp. WAC05374]